MVCMVGGCSHFLVRSPCGYQPPVFWCIRSRVVRLCSWIVRVVCWFSQLLSGVVSQLVGVGVVSVRSVVRMRVVMVWTVLGWWG